MFELHSVLGGIGWRDAVEWAALLVLATLLGAIAFIVFRRTQKIYFDLDFLSDVSSNLDADFKQAVAPLASARIAIGKLGELTTALMFVRRGWIQIPSQPNGITNLDGIFLKAVGRKKFNLAIVETKASINGNPTANFKNEQTAEKIKSDLERLTQKDNAAGQFLPEEVAQQLITALSNNNVNIKSRLYAHDFKENVCRIYKLDKNGEKKGKGKIVKGIEHKALVLTAKTYVYRLMTLRAQPGAVDVEAAGIAAAAVPEASK